jgi:hypothetical protein
MFVLMTLSCHTNDDNSPNEISIAGSWNLIHVSGGLAGIDDDFETGLITWSFNEETSSVLVVNNNSEAVIYDGFPSGNYTYSIELNEDIQTLIINDISMIIHTLTATDLILDEGIAVDGFLLSLKR